MMSALAPRVFLLDVDNTLLDNDRFVADLTQWLDDAVGKAARTHYWSIYAERRQRLGYADYLGALQALQDAYDGETMLIRMSSRLLDYPFKDLLYPKALAAIEHLRKLGTTVIFSDGDILFQPRKIQTSGLWEAVDGCVLVYPHKERRLNSLQRHFPAQHYVIADDKPQLLAAMKRQMADQLTTVFVRQGHYAGESEDVDIDPAPDRTLSHIGELCSFTLSDFLGDRVVSSEQPSPPHNASRFPGGVMKPIGQLRRLGQNLWLDNVTRQMLDDGTLGRYIQGDTITGLTLNPPVLDNAIVKGPAYDPGIRLKVQKGIVGEQLLTELALEDLCRAADLFLPLFEASQHVNGWVAMDISPLLARDSEGSIRAARHIQLLADRPNLMVSIPGTPEGLPAIEASIYAGVPINVTSLFSPAHYLAAAEAYLRGIERRLESGLNLQVGSIASVCVNAWDHAGPDRVPQRPYDQIGTAIGAATYQAYRKLLDSPRWRRLAIAGAHPQRLAWVSNNSKDRMESDMRHVEALAAPDTIHIITENTLLACADHGEFMDRHGLRETDTLAEMASFQQAGIDLDMLARQLQDDSVKALVTTWLQLLKHLTDKSVALINVRRRDRGTSE
ncbi:transaldolase family protein [Mangrovitalea sediminis]|uniref:transaldolase family protein n=1 Tax=Mangrovitalea sediminis TaxID=1982043 RepID=UPI0018E9B85B|nr:transaldolase family protein [Mangrovitalea sediminis]